MKKNMTLYFLSFVFILSLLAQKQEYLPGELVVKGDIRAVSVFLEKQGYPIYKVENIENNIYTLLLENRKADIIQIARIVKDQVSGVEFAEANWILFLQDIAPPKDTYWLSQWAMDNIGQDSPSGAQGTPGADIAILKAWEISKGSRDIVVGIIDTGIDYTHPDLKDNIWVNEAELKGIDGKDDDGNGYTDDKYGWNFITKDRSKPYYGQLGHPDPMDDHSHGTHCAGIIGAKPDNYRGIAGVNWHVKLMALKFLGKEGYGNSVDAYRAIMYAVRNNVDILSNSWGGGSKSDLLLYAIREAQKKGILVVAAAGNSASNIDQNESYPASYPVENIISVAATDNKDQLATFSNYGSESVHIAAPGVDIMSTIPVAKADKDKFAYRSFSGTSMATPFVAGAAALLLAANPSFKSKPAEIKKRLLHTVSIMPHLAGRVKSQGRLNVYRALANQTNEISIEEKIHTKELDITAPRFHQESFDKVWQIQQPGAKYMRLHFSWVIADIPHMDLIGVYDRWYRLIFKFEKQYPEGFWTPWIQGDTILVRFANALVAIETMEEKEFPSPQDGFKEGAVVCHTNVETKKTVCYIPKLSFPFPNFESEGFHIDKLEYRKEDSKEIEHTGKEQPKSAETKKNQETDHAGKDQPKSSEIKKN